MDHFGSVCIVGRSGWGKTWQLQEILKQHNLLHEKNIDSLVYLTPDDYKSWNRWIQETTTITNGGSVMTSLYGRRDTILIEDIHTTFLWNSSVRMKFLAQIQTIAKHSNIIVTMDQFGVKVPTAWRKSSSWNQLIYLKPPSVDARTKYCQNHPTLSSLGEQHIAFILETIRDTSFRSLDRVARFLEQNERNDGVVPFSVLRQAIASVTSVYLPPGLFKNATEWIQNPNISRDTLERMYDEDPFHFPYLIWNTLPQLCYHNGKPGVNLLDWYERMLRSLTRMDESERFIRKTEFISMYHSFHSAWFVRESIVFTIPNIRNKISYSKVREKTVLKAAIACAIPPMFSLQRMKEDTSLHSSLPQSILTKIK